MKHTQESALIVILALVKSKRLHALQKRPEVLQSVRVDTPLRIAKSVVDNSPVVVAFKIVVRHKRICANGRTLRDVLPNIAAKLWPTRVADYFKNNSGGFTGSRSFQDTLHSGLLKPHMSNTGALVFVHVTGLCPD